MIYVNIFYLASIAIVLSGIGDALFCQNGMHEHNDFTGAKVVTRCCRKVDCGPGYEAKICDNENEAAKCIPCPEGTYKEGDYSSVEIDKPMKCQPQQQCDVSKNLVEAGKPSATSKTKCRCRDGYYMIDGVDECKSCKRGQKVNVDGRGCVECGFGFYSPAAGLCVICTYCNKSQIVEEMCNSHNDTVCGIPAVQSLLTSGYVSETWRFDIVIGILVSVLATALVYTIILLLVRTMCRHRAWSDAMMSPDGNRTANHSDAVALSSVVVVDQPSVTSTSCNRPPSRSPTLEDGTAEPESHSAMEHSPMLSRDCTTGDCDACKVFRPRHPVGSNVRLLVDHFEAINRSWCLNNSVAFRDCC